MMVSADGKRKQILEYGERKSLTTDRVILVLGPRVEVERVRKMFSMAVAGIGGTAIARDLNQRGEFKRSGKPGYCQMSTTLLLIRNTPVVMSGIALPNVYGKRKRRSSHGTG